jgi:hypothetical protein
MFCSAGEERAYAKKGKMANKTAGTIRAAMVIANLLKIADMAG